MSTLEHSRGDARGASAVSPELVLVDPLLAESARARLAAPPDVLIVRRAGRDDGPARSAPTRVPDLLPASAPVLSLDWLRANALPASARVARARDQWSRRFVILAASGCAVLAVSAFGYGVQTGSQGSHRALNAPSQGVLGTAEEADGRPPLGGRPKVQAASPKAPAARGPQRFAWAPAPLATGYHVELFRGSTRIFTADVKKPEIVVPRKWQLDGRPESLAPGEYRWYVWPVAEGRRQSVAIVQATLVVPTR